VRCTQFYSDSDPETNRRFLKALDSYQASSEVAQDETTEQVFSRKDRKAYRAEVLGQRTETKRGNAKRKASAMGKEGGPKAKTRRTA
jgi:phage FluMu gp28-like protein